MAYYFDPTHPTYDTVDRVAELTGFATGSQALLFWGGALVIGALVPLIVAFVARKKEGSALLGMAGIGVLCAAVGGVCFRIVMYALSFSPWPLY